MKFLTKLNTLKFPIALSLLAASAQAQAPVFIALPSGSQAWDVSVTPANGVVVVGTQAGGAFRWTPAGGLVTIGVNHLAGVPVRISSNGSTIAGTLALNPRVAALWSGSGTTWNPIPGIPGGLSGDVGGGQYIVAQAGAVNADGSVVAGLAYSAFGVQHGFRWNSGSGLTTDLEPNGQTATCAAMGVDGNGAFIVGWQDNSGPHVGVRWVNGVKSYFAYGANALGDALAVNHTGTIVVGKTLSTLPGVAWRWDAGTNAATLLSNLPADGSSPYPADLTDDGSLIVGHDGAPELQAARKAVIWVNGVPQNPLSYLGNLGMAPTGFTDLNFVTGVSRDGSALVGYGLGGASGEPPGGWIVLFPGQLPIGTAFCFGDGTDAPCPCTNPGAAGRGCQNTFATGGASLSGSGVASISADSLVLRAANTGPFQFGLYYEGSTTYNPTAPFGIGFGNGIRCVGTSAVNRLEIRQGDASGVSATTASMSVLGAAVAGTTYIYQLWYRDGVPPATVGTCLTSGFNFSNALSLTWTP